MKKKNIIEVLIELYDKSDNVLKYFIKKKYKIINNKLIDEFNNPAACILEPIMYNDSIYYRTTTYSDSSNTIYTLLRYTDKNGIDYGNSYIINKKVIVIDSLGTYVELKNKLNNKDTYYIDLYKKKDTLIKNYSYSSLVYFSDIICSDTILSANDDIHTTTIITTAT